MGCSSPAKIVTLHNTCKSAAFADADHVHASDFLEDINANILANLNAFIARWMRSHSCRRSPLRPVPRPRSDATTSDGMRTHTYEGQNNQIWEMPNLKVLCFYAFLRA